MRPGAGGRVPDDRDVLAALDRQLEADPVLAGLRARLAGPEPGPQPGASRTLLVTGLALLVLACLTLSVPVAASGCVTALLAFRPPLVGAVSSWRRCRRDRSRPDR